MYITIFTKYNAIYAPTYIATSGTFKVTETQGNIVETSFTLAWWKGFDMISFLTS